MADLSAEQIVQRITDTDLLDMRQIEGCWSELGTRAATGQEFRNLLLRRELLTNWQIDRLLDGKRTGFYYGKYRVLYYIGAGTFARVYRAEHRETGEVVAVKVLRQRYAADPQATEHFLREAAMVKPLIHPNIVPVHDVDSERGSYYMVMDFVEGQNLRDLVRVHGKLELSVALGLAADIASGLNHAFVNGVTHRDLKLSNVLVSSKKVGRIVDFGLGHAAAAGNETAGRSIDYAGLEKCSNVPKNDKRSDIFFVGAMMYQLICGVPAMAETRDRLQRMSVQRFTDIKPITTHLPNLPHRVAAVVAKAMDVKADQRFQTPGELHSELVETIEKIKQGLGDEPLPNKPASAQGRPNDKEGVGRTVMLIETEGEMQDVIRDLLKKRGYRVLVIGDPERALSRFDGDEKAADCVIFSISKLGAPGFQGFIDFARDEFTQNIPCVLLIDKSQQAFVKQHAPLNDHRLVISTPLKASVLRKALYVLIQNSEKQEAQ